MSTPKSSMSVWVIRIGPTAVLEFDQRLPCLYRARYRTLHHSDVIPSHGTMSPAVSNSVNPKSKLKSSVLTTFRGTKNSKKIQKNEPDPSDE